MNGVDLSRNNPVVDWSKVDDTIQFALIRGGYGNDISQKDKKVDEYVKAALAHNIHVGGYWFSYATSLADAQQEASVANSVFAPYKGKMDFPIAFDYEYDSIAYATRNHISVTASADMMARAFMDAMKRYGWFVNLYTNLDFIRSGKFSAATRAAYDVWLADYSGAPNYPCYIQQTSSTGSIPGITGNVDLDISFRDYPTIIKNGGYNGFPKPAQTVVKIDTTTPVHIPYGQMYTFFTECGQRPTVVCGTSGVMALEHCRREGNRDFWHIISIGKPGQATGVYTAGPGEHGLRRFVAYSA